MVARCSRVVRCRCCPATRRTLSASRRNNLSSAKHHSNISYTSNNLIRINILKNQETRPDTDRRVHERIFLARGRHEEGNFRRTSRQNPSTSCPGPVPGALAIPGSVLPAYFSNASALAVLESSGPSAASRTAWPDSSNPVASSRCPRASRNWPSRNSSQPSSHSPWVIAALA